MVQVKCAFIVKADNPGRLSLALSLAAVWSLLLAGCGMVPQSSAATSAQAASSLTPGISIQTALPGAVVGSNYHAVLSVAGGLSPYRFSVIQGGLPTGLLLNAETGSISGSPTHQGSFSFTIQVTGASKGTNSSNNSAPPAGSTGSRAYTMTVDSCAKCIFLQILPVKASLAASGKLQFTATLSNTSNTAVIWSASEGSISTTGLFTAPPNSKDSSVTITARSVGNSGVVASTGVTILDASGNFEITTRSIPAAVKAKPYSATLATAGGEPPYSWSVIKGSLPAGLHLDASTGTLAGETTETGIFTFMVRGTDAASQQVHQSLTLDVSANANCGPPSYNCSRTDLDIVQVPARVPDVGKTVGANRIVTDPNFGNPIVRITDWNTDPTLPSANRSYVSATSGSADENLWNVDSTLFILQSVSAWTYPFTFNSRTMQAARMYTSTSSSTNGFRLVGGGIWSRVNPNLLYTVSGSVISKYDFTDRATPPTPQSVYDFAGSHACLPAHFSVTWISKGGGSADDTVFGVAFSDSGDQGTGIYALAYKVGSGCTVLNTRTGQVGGEWGSRGAIDIQDRWTVHNVKLSRDGKWLVIVPQNCTSAICSHGPYFWQIGTTNVNSCEDGKSSGQKCAGHWTEGYTHWVNNYDNGKQASRPFSEPTAIDELSTLMPTGIKAPLDEHSSWNNADPADSLPFFLTYWSPTTPFPAAWYNEITGVAPDGSGKVWRFAHNFITAKSQYFGAEYGIGSVSQDGKFFIFSSDWMGTLGSESGEAKCTIGANCRGDVFVLGLN